MGNILSTPLKSRIFPPKTGTICPQFRNILSTTGRNNLSTVKEHFVHGKREHFVHNPGTICPQHPYNLSTPMPFKSLYFKGFGASYKYYYNYISSNEEKNKKISSK